MKTKSIKTILVSFFIVLLLISNASCLSSPVASGKQSTSQTVTTTSPATQVPTTTQTPTITLPPATTLVPPTTQIPTTTQAPITTVPTTTPPPPTQAPALSKALSLGSKQAGNLMVSLASDPNPPIRGNNNFEALITDTQGQQIIGAKISFDLNMTNMNMGKNLVTAASLGNGRYGGKVFFSMSGPWRVIISIEQAEKTDTVRFDFTVNFN